MMSLIILKSDLQLSKKKKMFFVYASMKDEKCFLFFLKASFRSQDI